MLNERREQSYQRRRRIVLRSDLDTRAKIVAALCMSHLFVDLRFMDCIALRVRLTKIMLVGALTWSAHQQQH